MLGGTPDPNSRPPRKDYSLYALVGHVLVAAAAVVVMMMYIPVITGEASGEGAGMGVFLLIYFLGIPLALAAAAAVFFSIHSPNPGLLLPTVLLLLGVPLGVTLRNDLAFVIALSLYIVAVLRAILLRARKMGAA